uniref:AttH domain-containing protein n=1 Tax=mine drainage metagenome TaxID=410659 RepID=E6Q7Y5_9ZZZZ
MNNLPRILRSAVATLALFAMPFGMASGAQPWRIARAPYRFTFPRDHDAHDAYRTEWWYFTGHLRDSEGRRYGFELTFFRIGLRPHPYRVVPGVSAWRGAQLYSAHFAITDIRDKRFFYAETLARDALGQGYASQRRLLVRVNGWSLRGSSAVEPRMRLHAAARGNAIDLRVVPEKPPVVEGPGGISRKGACASCASHYYSFTRLRTSGTLQIAGRRVAVRGVAWMDHEYGSDELSPGQVGWDWFSIQLDDRREIMLYRLREKNGATTPQSSGTIVAQNGRPTYLSLRDFHITATGTWRSPRTHALYPSGWIVRVAGIAEPLRLVPVLDDQELASAGTTYWEGAVRVLNARTGRRLGRGYVELTGYAGAISL